MFMEAIRDYLFLKTAIRQTHEHGPIYLIPQKLSFLLFCIGRLYLSEHSYRAHLQSTLASFHNYTHCMNHTLDSMRTVLSTARVKRLNWSHTLKKTSGTLLSKFFNHETEGECYKDLLLMRWLMVTIRPWKHFMHQCGCWAYTDGCLSMVPLHFIRQNTARLVILKAKFGITAGSFEDWEQETQRP